MTHRRLPIYLVLDVSGSMCGEPIEACRQGLKALLADLRSDPAALENAFLSIITFGLEVKHVPLSDLATFQEPTLDANGFTPLGEALIVLENRISSEVRKNTPEQKGDYKPLVFLMTDGKPTDQWKEPANRLKSLKPANIIACAAGPGADEQMLRELTETVVKLQSLQPDQLKAFFKWVSASVRSTSQRIGASPNGGGMTLPPPPEGINIVI
jgi:uncharacterized protein YegL